MNFHIGQKVVYITGKYMPKGSIHKVEGIFQYPCGCNGIYIREKSKTPSGFRLICPTCAGAFNRDHYPNGGWNAKSFRPLSERSAESESFSETLIKELEIEINETNLIEK